MASAQSPPISLYPTILAHYERSLQTSDKPSQLIYLDCKPQDLRDRAVADVISALAIVGLENGLQSCPPDFSLACTDDKIDAHETVCTSYIAGKEYTRIKGVLFNAEKDLNHSSSLRHDFGQLILNARWPDTLPEHLRLPVEDTTVDKITNLFEALLLFGGDKPGWRRFALPAFPCKSTNTDKVYGSDPDGAEYEALTTLCEFAKRVVKVYTSCEIYIVSDGHVFSDCTGVDDQVVNRYNAKLMTMLSEIREELHMPASARVLFRNLKQLLSGDADAHNMDEYIKDYDPAAVTHPVKTEIDSLEDAFRHKLLQYCAPPKEYIADLKDRVPDHSTTALYRGFHRFMLDDLSSHPDNKDLSANERNKQASRVALEMIVRNQAYSRLVELVCPSMISLSIHAHENAGPKFAVGLIPFANNSDSVPELRITTVEDAKEPSDKHLHISTPWHSCLAEIDGMTVVCKSKILRDAIKNGRFSGGWTEKRGGRYILTTVTDDEGYVSDV
ncbi:dityrosine synthesis enzyme [Elasticomyces elasticus]|nr:dityrosine synthesis enzyme [Elasticomyces elasticus]